MGAFKKYNSQTGQWEILVSGPAGFTGSSGTTGFTGSAGTAGSLGYTGSASTTIGYTGSQGNTGLGFTVAKSYVSVAALTADTSPTGIVAGQFAIIETGNVDNSENSRLYLWSGNSYSYVNDLSGAAGITGPQGTTGFTGSIGVGYTGSSGPGFTGSIGFTGSTGNIGFTGSKGTSNITSGNTAPVSPAFGDLWYNTDLDILLQYLTVSGYSYWLDLTGPVYSFGQSASEAVLQAQSTNTPPTVQYLLVAGGGGGGGGGGTSGAQGGGGAGGYLTGNVSVSAGLTYSFVIGAGAGQGTQGSNTTGFSLTAIGGGAGGQPTAGNGGSGGGGGFSATVGGSGTAGPPRQGYDGGRGHNSSGGGNSGGGGGGGGNSGGSSGGSGIVIVAYPSTYAAAFSTTGSPTVTVVNGLRIYTFTSSGSITI